MIRFLFIFICLCATSSFALIEVIKPDAIDDSDTWDSTGSGATKTIRITDGIDGNYIFTPTDENVDRYTLEDLTATDIDEVDSVVLYVTAQDNGSGNNRITIGIRIGTDLQQSSTIALTTSWVEYTLSATSPPGARGTWDDFEVDSLRVTFHCSSIGGSREVRITECSLKVFYSSNERTLMFPEKDDACLTGTNYDHDLLRKSAMQNDTAFVFVNDGADANDFWKTGDASTTYHKMNNDDWETGGFGIFLDIVHAKADGSLQVRIQRYNSSCALQESTPFFPTSGALILIDTTGHYEIQIPQHDWSSGSCSDELVVQFQWSNILFEADDSIWVLYGGADTYFEHEIVINKGGCPEGTGSGDCDLQANQDSISTQPNQAGGISQFVNVGAAPDKITAIADDVDANYMMENTTGEQQEVQFDAITEPTDLAQYDSITVVWRARRNTQGGGRVRLRTQLQDSTDVTKECNDVYVVIKSVAFGDFEPLTVSGLPSGGDACEGAFTTAGINTLEVKLSAQSIANNREAWVTSVDLVICYTTTSDAQNFRRIRMIKMGSIDDKTIWDTYFDQELVVKDGYETSVTFGVPSKKWMWSRL